MTTDKDDRGNYLTENVGGNKLTTKTKQGIKYIKSEQEFM